MAEGPSWRVDIVTHRPLVPEYLDCDPQLDVERFVALNVSDHDIAQVGAIRVVNQRDLAGFTPLGRHWAETEGILSVWRSGHHLDVDYVGFTQWDKPLRLNAPAAPMSLTREINRQVRSWEIERLEGAYGSLETHSFRGDYDQRILADVTRPDQLTGRGTKAYRRILRDINAFHGTHYSLASLYLRRNIALCSSFLVHRAVFTRMMAFFDAVRPSLEELDPNRRFRLQGGLAERYYGVYLSLFGGRMIDLSTPHEKPEEHRPTEGSMGA